MLINSTKQLLLNLPRSIKRGVVIITDLLICVLSVWLAFGLRLDQWGYFQSHQWIVLFIAIISSFPIFFASGLYRAIFRYVGSVAFKSITRAFIIYSVIFIGIFTLYGIENVPRSIGIIQPMLLFFGIGAIRYFIRHWLGGVSNIQKASRRTNSIALIYGAGSAGRQLASALISNNEILVKGFIDDAPELQGYTINGLSVYPNTNLKGLIYRLDISDIFFAIPSASQDCRNRIISSLIGCGVRVRSLAGLNDLVSGKVRASDLHDLDINDLLGRTVVPPALDLLERNIRDRVVLVTGAGGSIGSELCRQIIKFSPKSLIMLDNSEHNLYLINEELRKVLIKRKNEHLVGSIDDETYFPHNTEFSIQLVPCLASVRDRDLIIQIFKAYKVETVYHAAAYKHVPLVEKNPVEGIRNNVYGTLTCAQASLQCGVKNFILVSTDKAVRPTNVMGASKRIAELILQAMDALCNNGNKVTIFSMVRFGNVLGSSGSVVPLFRSQIKEGGPITLTHLETTRYFMTIPEAAQLVIQASSVAEGGEVFLLDMGKPVRIYDLALKMIHLSGLLVKDEYHPHGDIEIKITGLRPGEKLHEELLIKNTPQPTTHSKIMRAHEEFLFWDDLQDELQKLNLALEKFDSTLIIESLKKLVPGYQPNSHETDQFEENFPNHYHAN